MTTDRADAPNSPATFPADSYPHLEVEAALCIWEEMLRRNTLRDGGDVPLSDLWEEVGTSQMRMVAMALAAPIEAAYNALGSGLHDSIGPFDWEFIPMALAFVDWPAVKPWCYQTGAPIDYPVTLVTSAIACDVLYGQWRREARQSAGRIWGYPDLIDDDPDGARRAFEAGEDATAYIEAIGKSLDLATPDPMTAADLAKAYPVLTAY